MKRALCHLSPTQWLCWTTANLPVRPACTRYNWLKLEDVRTSLFVNECTIRFSAQRRLGERVPRYVKFLQGTLLLALLLLVIWLPLLVFSSGAPTYAAPAITSLGVNVSITSAASLAGAASADGQAQGIVELPLMRAGHR